MTGLLCLDGAVDRMFDISPIVPISIPAEIFDSSLTSTVAPKNRCAIFPFLVFHDTKNLSLVFDNTSFFTPPVSSWCKVVAIIFGVKIHQNFLQCGIFIHLNYEIFVSSLFFSRKQIKFYPIYFYSRCLKLFRQ